jgi:hypothetical protein
VSNLSVCRKGGKNLLRARTPGARAWLITFAGFLFLALANVLIPNPGWGAGASVEVRRLGLSKVGENTLLTVVLDRPAEPRVSSRKVSGKPQLVVEFPLARAARLPARLAGDDFLVEQVVSETSTGGVRIILDLFPDRPFAFWRQNRQGASGQTLFILGLKTEGERPPAQARLGAWPEPETTPLPLPNELPERESGPITPEGPVPESGNRETGRSVAPGTVAELRQLMPKAGPLFQSLESDGWAIAESHQYDRPGQRFSSDFTLSNPKYSQLVVKVAYLPANAPNTPNISIISLSTENLGGETAAEYQNLRQWNFARIKQKYEDIGDFFEDALKPLRVKLREQTKNVALRDAAVFQNFLKQAFPQDPQVADQAMSHIREKVNPRFEGVQYTISENPLIILNMVDFLYVKVYYLDGR